MGPAAFLEILQDTAIELIDVFETGLLHERPGFFATDPARAKHHDGLLFHCRRQLAHSLGKLTEVIDPGGQRTVKGSHPNLVVVARVEERYRAAFIEPLLERFGGKFGGGVPAGFDALDAEGDDFPFDFHQHPVVRLAIALALLGL